MDKTTDKPLLKTVHCVVCDRVVDQVPFDGQRAPRVSAVCPACLEAGYRVLLGTFAGSNVWAFEIVPPGCVSVLADAGDPIL